MMNAARGECSFSAVFHRKNAEQGTWHLLVERSGAMAPKAFFTTDVSPAKFYRSLKELGAKDVNNVNAANFDAVEELAEAWQYHALG